MEIKINVGRVTMQRHHEVLCGDSQIGTVLVTTHITNGNEDTTYTAHVHKPRHEMLDTANDATFGFCLAAIVAAYEAVVGARDATAARVAQQVADAEAALVALVQS